MGAFANPPIIEGPGPSDGDVPTWDATSETWVAAPGGGGGVQTLQLSYNGNGPVAVQVLAGTGWDPTVGGYLTAALPSALTGFGIWVTAWCAVDGTGTITGFTFTADGYFYAIDSAGSDATIGWETNGGAVALLNTGDYRIDAGSHEWTFTSDGAALTTPSGHRVWNANVLSDLAGLGTDGDWAILTGDSSPPVFAVHYNGAWQPYAPEDIGWLTHYVIGPGSETVAQAQVTAPPNQGPAGFTAHVPSVASGVGMVALTSGQAIQVTCDPGQMAAGLWDAIDGYGQVQIMTIDGSSSLVASLGLLSFPGPGSPQTFGLTAISSTGSDLSIVGGNTIASAAGGAFLVIVQAQAEWD